MSIAKGGLKKLPLWSFVSDRNNTCDESLDTTLLEEDKLNKQIALHGGYCLSKIPTPNIELTDESHCVDSDHYYSDTDSKSYPNDSCGGYVDNSHNKDVDLDDPKNPQHMGTESTLRVILLNSAIADERRCASDSRSPAGTADECGDARRQVVGHTPPQKSRPREDDGP